MDEKHAREERIKRLLNRVPTVTVEHQGINHHDPELIDRKVREHQQKRELYEEQLL
jgi:predicted metallo-beta-lactamase superfamily hydrolase